MTTVLPTSRAIRQQILAHHDESLFLKRYMTMGELMQRAVVVEGYQSVDDDTRTLLLFEAADFESFAELQIERNFFSFTRNASYLFRFFEELSGELVDIAALDQADTYGDFAEHIAILTLLRERYRNVCLTRRILDRIFLPELYELNTTWIKSLDGLEISAEGYLTNFELKLLFEISELIPVVLAVETTAYNVKMQEKLGLYGFKTKPGYRYRLALDRQCILSEDVSECKAEIRATPLSERIVQTSFIKQKIFEMVSAGIAPERIAVVLPDEGFVPLLRPFDTEGNFNFAMGEPLSNSLFVRRCEALLAYDEHPGVENGMRLLRLLGNEGKTVAERFSHPVDPGGFENVTDALLEAEAENIATMVREERFYFERLIRHLGENSLRALLHLFVNRIKGRSIDDVRGGKVTVMGVLETRACRFDGVVIVDFNESYVPHRSDKDLFINSGVRGRAGLPTTPEREALQKQFYYMLISRAKRVEIAYVQNESVLPSRFLKELGIASSRQYDDEEWAEILFARTPRRQKAVDIIEGEYDFANRPLSATGLKTFLECPRRFYYRYVEGLTPHKMPREMPEEYEIGNTLHNALRDVYTSLQHYPDAKTLETAMAQALAEHSGTSPLERFLQQLWLKRLEPFFRREAERFTTVRVDACEIALKQTYGRLTLEGRIDRIDRGPDGLEVLDYKSGKYALYTSGNVENATDFQLEFYTLLAAQRGEVAYSGYYDLNSGAIVTDPTHTRKMELLTAHLQTLQEKTHYSFDMTEELKRCRFCDFAYLCGREIT